MTTWIFQTAVLVLLGTIAIGVIAGRRMEEEDATFITRMVVSVWGVWALIIIANLIMLAMALS